MKINKAKSTLACAITLALSTQCAFAAEQTQEKQKVERIVVSGTPTGVGVRKIDASYAVTNIDS
ncbi:MAG: hypothetical protein V7683_17095, partial [Pseudoalteromonas distincta]